MSAAGRVLSYITDHSPRFVEELRTLVRFPSISADPKRRKDLRACAGWLTRHLASLGLRRARLLETPGHPVVTAEWLEGADRPTVLIYGHYDVQPVDPLAAWRIPPFEGTVRDGTLWGRGVSDDKGQLFAHLKAIEAHLATTGSLPANLICVLEGEEEIGSLHLAPALDRIPRLGEASVAVISDTRMLGRNAPALTYSLRGELKFEVQVQGSKTDLHSGHYGGAVHDPIQALCEMLATLHDRGGRVAVPGFYDAVLELSPEERANLSRFAPNDVQFERMAGTDHPWGDSRFSLFERATLRPALIINGIAGGYAGPGHKAVLPACAVAKLSARLVPNQKPEQVERALRSHFSRVSPPTVHASFICHSGAAPVRIDPRHPMMRMAAGAYHDGFGVPAVMLPSGGTIPVVSLLKERFGIPTVLMGYALPDDQPHAPNEKFDLDTFFQGIATSARFLQRVGAASVRRRRALSEATS